METTAAGEAEGTGNGQGEADMQRGQAKATGKGEEKGSNGGKTQEKRLTGIGDTFQLKPLLDSICPRRRNNVAEPVLFKLLPAKTTGEHATAGRAGGQFEGLQRKAQDWGKLSWPGKRAGSKQGVVQVAPTKAWHAGPVWWMAIGLFLRSHPPAWAR